MYWLKRSSKEIEAAKRKIDKMNRYKRTIAEAEEIYRKFGIELKVSTKTTTFLNNPEMQERIKGVINNRQYGLGSESVGPSYGKYIHRGPGVMLTINKSLQLHDDQNVFDNNIID